MAQFENIYSDLIALTNDESGLTGYVELFSRDDERGYFHWEVLGESANAIHRGRSTSVDAAKRRVTQLVTLA